MGEIMFKSLWTELVFSFAKIVSAKTVKKGLTNVFVIWACVISNLQLAMGDKSSTNQNPFKTNLVYNPDLNNNELKKEVYIYQNQSMGDVSWFYGGLVPRMEDPKRIKVVFSKKGYTMRVTLHLTKEEIANYPYYLVERAREVAKVFQEMNIQVFPEKRNQMMFDNYIKRLLSVEENYDASWGYSPKKYEVGLMLLKKHFPKNIFELPNSQSTSSKKNISVHAHFVYPITIHKSGNEFPKDGVYIQADQYANSWDSINERRTEYFTRQKVDTDGDGIPDKTVRVFKNHIFSGFPAFWIDALGAGTGVHGPIRYSELDQSQLGQSGPYGKNRDEMARFWAENEFIKVPDLLPDVDSLGRDITSKLRWDVIRTNDSNGCFRAETLELRHLLPSDPEVIHHQIRWNVITELDENQSPRTIANKWVDIDYYVIHPYKFPLTRKQWIDERILTSSERKSEDKEKRIKEIINNSIQFPYLDPATIEIVIGVPQGKNKGQQKLNRARPRPNNGET